MIKTSPETNKQRIEVLEKEDKRIWIEMSKVEGRVNKNTENEVFKIKDYINSNEKNMNEFNTKIENIKTTLTEVKTDVSWIKKGIFAVAIPSVLSLLISLIQFVLGKI